VALIETGRALIAKYVADAAASVQPKAVELPVQGVIAGVRVQGIVDLLCATFQRTNERSCSTGSKTITQFQTESRTKLLLDGGRDSRPPSPHRAGVGSSEDMSFEFRSRNRIRDLTVDGLENVVRQQILLWQFLPATLRLLDGVADDLHYRLHGKPCGIREAAHLVDCDPI